MADHRLRQISALVVGAGATGQVIGKHLALAGVQTSLFVKHKYASVSDEGFELHHFAPFGKHTRLRFDDFKILHDVATLRERHFDQIYVCVSSPDLRSGWLEEFFPHQRHAIWVMFQPGLRDYEYVASIVPKRYIVQGTPGFLAYHGPLEGDDDVYPPGVAYWRPPFQSTLFEGPDERTTTSVTRLLDAGGLKCGVSSNLLTRNLYRRAIVLTAAMGLEIQGWSIDDLCADKAMLGVLGQVAGELYEVVEQATGRPSRGARRYSKGWWWKVALKATRAFTPFPLEPYCRKHFMRRRAELEHLLDDYEALAKTVHRPTKTTNALREQWRATRSGIETPERSDLTPAGMVVPELNSPGVAFGAGPDESQAPAAASSQSIPAPASGSAQSLEPPASGSSHSLKPSASGSSHSLTPASSSSSQPIQSSGNVPDDPQRPFGHKPAPAPSNAHDRSDRPSVQVGGARQVASGDVSETGPMDAEPPPKRSDLQGESDDVSSTAPMSRSDAGPRHSLTFSSGESPPQDPTAPLEAQPAPSFLEDENDAGE